MCVGSSPDPPKVKEPPPPPPPPPPAENKQDGSRTPKIGQDRSNSRKRTSVSDLKIPTANVPKSGGTGPRV